MIIDFSSDEYAPKHTKFRKSKLKVHHYGYKKRTLTEREYKQYLRIYRRLKRHGLMLEELRAKESFTSSAECWIQVGATFYDLDAKSKIDVGYYRQHIMYAKFC